MREFKRIWCGLCRYTGLGQFRLGTVFADTSEQARIALADLWKRTSPHPAPDDIVPIPGAVIFHPRDASNA